MLSTAVFILIVLAIVVIAALLLYTAELGERLRLAKSSCNALERNYRDLVNSEQQTREALRAADRRTSDTVKRLLDTEGELHIAQEELSQWKRKCQQLIDEITRSKPKPLVQRHFEFMSREPVEL